MLVRWRNAASTIAACEVIIGEPSSVHFGAMTAVARSAISSGLPRSQEPLPGALVEHRLLRAGDRHDDRLPEIVAFRGPADVSFAREDL
jgi:hypothetical protein